VAGGPGHGKEMEDSNLIINLGIFAALERFYRVFFLLWLASEKKVYST
jgi:hypothetical protein